MPAPTTPEQFLKLLAGSGLVDPPRLEGYTRRRRDAGGLPATPRELAGVLVRDGLLTPFQAEQLLAGRSRNFVLGGKYKVLQPLGSGGMGQVYLCEHAVMCRLVAVKMLPRARAGDDDAVERFHREVRAAARLHHPNIVTAYDADRDGDCHFLVMEFVDGRTLSQLVRQVGPLPAGRAADYVRQAALGLHHAHSHGLVHRDVKPSNLLVDGGGTVKVLDLGLARFFHDDDDLSRRHGYDVVGTAEYMAPEQAEDSRTADARADVYSLGGTLYFLLAGHNPFRGGAGGQSFRHPTRRPRPIREVRPDVPAAVAAIVDRMMATDPASRHRTTAEVAEDLGAWARPGPPPPPRAAAALAGPPSGPSDLGGSRPRSGGGSVTTEESDTVLSPGGAGGVGPAARRRTGTRWAWAAIAGVAALLFGGAVVGLALYRPGGPSNAPQPNPPGPPPGAAGAPRLRLLVPAYFYPGGETLGEWERLLASPEPASVVIVANPDSGPGRATDPNYARALGLAREKGFAVLGYVSTRYAERPAREVEGDVDRWVRLYPGVAGIFFDEQASGSEHVHHYAQLSEYARKQPGLGLVVSNPGTTCAEEYLARPSADVFGLVESGEAFTRFHLPAWSVNHPADRFAVLISRVLDPARMKGYVLSMTKKHVGYCYVTDDVMPNPWDRLPSYWEAEVDAVRQVNRRAAGR